MLRITLLFLILVLTNYLSEAQTVYRLSDIPVKVQDTILENPYTGGIDLPQFNMLDFNLDGIEDLLVFDRRGGVLLPFTMNNGQWIYQEEFVSLFPPVQHMVILEDYNNDGIKDIFTHSSVPGIQGMEVHKGKEVNGHLEYELVKFPHQSHDLLFHETSSGNYTNIFISSFDYPAITDVDDDGDTDILTFEDGTGSYLYYFKNFSVERGFGDDSLIFKFENSCWGRFYESEFSDSIILSPTPMDCATPLDGGGVPQARHAGSTLTVLDLDGDNDKDLLIGDLTNDNIVALYNEPENGIAWIREQDIMFPSYDVPVDIHTFVATFYEDVDLDGTRELLAAPNSIGASKSSNQIFFYENLGTDEGPLFDLVRRDYLISSTVDAGSFSIPAVTDFNADGTPDIMIGANNYDDPSMTLPVFYFLYNVGTPEEPSFIWRDDLIAPDFMTLNSTNPAPAFGDLDGDGDDDLLIGDSQGKLYYMENEANPGEPFEPSFPVYPYMDIDVGQFATPAIADINGDGLADIIVGEKNSNSQNNMACGTINYFQNVGTPGNPQFISEEETLPNTSCLGNVFTVPPGEIKAFSTPSIIDFGDSMELVIGNIDGRIWKAVINEDPYSEYELVTKDLLPVSAGEYSAPVFYDLNNDDVFELIIGTARGGIKIYNTDLKSDGTLPVTEINIEIFFKVFPNPSTSEVTILSALNIKDIKAYSTGGREITMNYDSGSGKINFKGFSGSLILEILTDDGVFYKQLIVLPQR